MNIDHRLLSLISSERRSFLVVLLAGLAGAIVAVWQALVLSGIIAQVFLGAADLDAIVGPMAGLLALILLRGGLIWIGEASAASLSIRLRSDLRSRLLDHLGALGPAYRAVGKSDQATQTGELLNTLVEGVESLDAYIGQYLPQVALAALVPLTILIFILRVDRLSAVVLMLTAPLIPLFMVLIGDAADAGVRRQWTLLSRMNGYFLDILQGLTTLKAFGRSREQFQTIARIGERYRQTTMGVLRIAFLSALALELIATIGTAILAVEIGLRLLYGRLAFEQAFFILLLAPEFYLPLRMLGTRFHAGRAGAAAVARMFQILETTAPAAKDLGPPATEQALARTQPPSIQFRDVSYAYPDRSAAITGLSFEIRAGEKVALVGESGAGKSTIAFLLLRFLEPDQGDILIDGQPLNTLSSAAWRKWIGWVPQDPYLFAGSVAENIRLGRPSADEADMARAVRDAHVQDFIQLLPDGDRTFIGERGTQLSGGQAQRIALARAFLKDAPLLILDEPTANLDPVQASLIESAWTKLLENRTVVIISHSLATSALADRILVLHNGHLVEQGRHAHLAGQGGFYTRLLRGADSPRNGSISCAKVETNWTQESSRDYRVIFGEPETQERLPSEKLRLPHRTILPVESASPSLSYRNRGPLSRSSLTILRRLLSLAGPFKGRIALSILLGFAAVASAAGLLGVSAYLISLAALQPSIAALQAPIAGVRFFGISRAVFRYFERYVSHDVTFRLLARLRLRFYQGLEPLAPAALMREASGDLLSRMHSDIAALESFYVRSISPPLVAILVIGGTTWFVAHFSFSLAIALLAIQVLAGAGLPLAARWVSQHPGQHMVRARARLSAALVDAIQGLADLLLFDDWSRYKSEIEGINRELSSFQERLARINATQMALQTILAHGSTWVLLFLAVPLIQNGRLDGVYLAALLMVALASFEALAPLPAAAQSLESHLEAASRLFDVMDARPAVQDPIQPEPDPASGDLEVRRLSFSYPLTPGGAAAPASLAPELDAIDVPPSGSHFSLEDIGLSLPGGKRMAIVGPSGSGKSTLIQLLLRFWEYSQGEIRLGGKDVRRYAQEDVRRALSVLFQEPYFFNDTLRQNLLLARPKASQFEMDRALKIAQLDEWVHSLPLGYDTCLGEQGLRLSGGQRQRLAIARAVLKDAPILILDEPTANLDRITARRLWEALFSQLVDKHSILIVTHRLEGMENLDEILVMNYGKILQWGKHAELVSQEGLYRQMWLAQNRLFLEASRSH